MGAQYSMERNILCGNSSAACKHVVQPKHKRHLVRKSRLKSGLVSKAGRRYWVSPVRAAENILGASHVHMKLQTTGCTKKETRAREKEIFPLIKDLFEDIVLGFPCKMQCHPFPRQKQVKLCPSTQKSPPQSLVKLPFGWENHRTACTLGGTFSRASLKNSDQIKALPLQWKQ